MTRKTPSGGKTVPRGERGGFFRENVLFRKAPYNRFEGFIAPDAGRLDLLVSVLEENGLKPRTLDVDGKRHVILGAAPRAGSPLVFAAHYDRAAKSPGANDNSAAVFMLIEAAMDLFGPAGENGASRPVIIFTDKEELSRGEGLQEQGAYSLALRLRDQGLSSARVFCFDTCGAGNTLIISTGTDRLLRNETSVGAARILRRVRELRSAALEASRLAGIEKVLLLPTPFSDDAGFLRAGLAAQTITVLPEAEAAAFASLARAKPDAALLADNSGFPATWRNLNGPGDIPALLTVKHWKNIARFAKALCYE